MVSLQRLSAPRQHSNTRSRHTCSHRLPSTRHSRTSQHLSCLQPLPSNLVTTATSLRRRRSNISMLCQHTTPADMRIVPAVTGTRIPRPTIADRLANNPGRRQHNLNLCMSHSRATRHNSTSNTPLQSTKVNPPSNRNITRLLKPRPPGLHLSSRYSHPPVSMCLRLPSPPRLRLPATRCRRSRAQHFLACQSPRSKCQRLYPPSI